MTKKKVSVLIPSYRRVSSLAVCLSSLYFQDSNYFDIIVADQNKDKRLKHPIVLTIIRMMENKGVQISFHKNLPNRGMAQQRQFLLDNSQTKYSLYLDDDLILEPWVIRKTLESLEEEQCGFAGRPVVGLSYKDDFRPGEENIELWEGEVKPEIVRPGDNKWQRHKLHNAANMWHVEKRLGLKVDTQVKYKIAWVGGFVMYDTEKLRKSGGFQFWRELPKNHVGEDVWAQLKLMGTYGGFGLLPSGVYHQELTTTIKDRELNAPFYFYSQGSMVSGP